MANNNEPAMAVPSSKPAPVSKSQQINRVADILSGKKSNVEVKNDVAATPEADLSTHRTDAIAEPSTEPDTDNGSAEPAIDEGETGAPITLKDLAAELKIDAKELYELQIPMGDGKAISLGELKDLAKKAQVESAELQMLRSQEIERSNEVMIARNELSTLVSALGDRVPPAEREALLELQGKHLARERQLLMAAIPAWRDPAVLQADRDLILDFAKNYGFNAQEVSAVTDHRLVKLLRDTAKGYAAARAAANTPKTPPKGMQPSVQGTKPSTLRAALARAKAPGATRHDKVSAVTALLSDKP